VNYEKRAIHKTHERVTFELPWIDGKNGWEYLYEQFEAMCIPNFQIWCLLYLAS
jgi:hypothetical protein